MNQIQWKCHSPFLSTKGFFVHRILMIATTAGKISVPSQDAKKSQFNNVADDTNESCWYWIQEINLWTLWPCTHHCNLSSDQCSVHLQDIHAMLRKTFVIKTRKNHTTSWWSLLSTSLSSQSFICPSSYISITVLICNLKYGLRNKLISKNHTREKFP